MYILRTAHTLGRCYAYHYQNFPVQRHALWAYYNDIHEAVNSSPALLPSGIFSSFALLAVSIARRPDLDLTVEGTLLQLSVRKPLQARPKSNS
jgi:hypothetical protein